MYHPNALGAMSEAHHKDLLRETAGTWRVERSHRASRTGGSMGRRLVAHPRLVTAAVTLLVAFGITLV